MDFSRIIDGLSASYDLRSELDRRRAYQECLKFAEEQVEAGNYTEFLRQAAEKLGQKRLFSEATNSLVRSSGRERLHLRFDENEGAQLVGNPDGLLYLSRVLRGLSQARHAGEYVYFYCGEAPMDESSIPLAVYREDEDFFNQIDEEGAESDYFYGGDTDYTAARRNLNPQDIAAFFLAGDAPEDLRLTPMKVYRVLGIEKAEFENAWPRPDLPAGTQAAVFSFARDDGELMRMAMRFDDPAVGFITHEELEGLVGR